MNAEQIKALIDTANNMSELASSMAAKCAKIEKENKRLLLETSAKYETIECSYKSLLSVSRSIEEVLSDNCKKKSKEELERFMLITFRNIVKVESSLILGCKK